MQLNKATSTLISFFFLIGRGEMSQIFLLCNALTQHQMTKPLLNVLIFYLHHSKSIKFLFESDFYAHKCTHTHTHTQWPLVPWGSLEFCSSSSTFLILQTSCCASFIQHVCLSPPHDGQCWRTGDSAMHPDPKYLPLKACILVGGILIIKW